MKKQIPSVSDTAITSKISFTKALAQLLPNGNENGPTIPLIAKEYPDIFDGDGLPIEEVKEFETWKTLEKLINNMKISCPIIACLLIACSPTYADSLISKGSVVSCDVIKVDALNPNDHPGFRDLVGMNYVQNPQLKVSHVYMSSYGNIENNELPIVSHGVKRMKAINMTTLGSTDGVYKKKFMDVGVKCICLIVKAQDFGVEVVDPPMLHPHPIDYYIGLPKYSVFYIIYSPISLSTDPNKELHNIHVEWARFIEKLYTADSDEKFKIFKKEILSDNPLISTYSVHLIAKLHPEFKTEHFEEMLLTSELSPSARLALEQELIITNKDSWKDSEGFKKNNDFFSKSGILAPEYTDLGKYRTRILERWFLESKSK